MVSVSYGWHMDTSLFLISTTLSDTTSFTQSVWLMTFSTNCPSALTMSCFGIVASKVQRHESLKNLEDDKGDQLGWNLCPRINCHQQSEEDKKETRIIFGSKTNEQPIRSLANPGVICPTATGFLYNLLQESFACLLYLQSYYFYYIRPCENTWFMCMNVSVWCDWH